MAKIYSKNVWEDEALADDPRFNILEDDGTPIYSDTQIAQVTDVIQVGTAVDASLMNNIEDGIDAIDTLLDTVNRNLTQRILTAYTTGGSSTAYTLTTTDAPELATNERWRVIFHTGSGATPTLNRDGKGAKSLRIYDASGTLVAPTSTTLLANMRTDVVYDGTYYIILDSFTTPPATSAEINTGTDAAKAVTPDAFAGSNFGIVKVQLMCFAPTENVAVGDTAGTGYFVVPEELNGMNLVSVAFRVITAGTTNSTTITIANVTDTQEMLSVAAAIETGEYSTWTSATPGTIDTAHDDVATGDLLKVNADSISTTAPKGLIAILRFQLP